MIDALPLLLAPEGYQISRSVRLRSSATAYFSRTLASAGNQKTWTWSGWAKRGSLGSQQRLFYQGNGSTAETSIHFTGVDRLQFEYYNAPSNYYLRTEQVFRDISAWYHIVVQWNTSDATASNRMRVWVNGIQVTVFNAAVYPPQNTDSNINSATQHLIGARAGGSEYFDGYLTEVNFIDGQALTPSSFGETDLTTGVWKPKKYTGTYGTNGFYLPFSDNATVEALGRDATVASPELITNGMFVSNVTGWTVATGLGGSPSITWQSAHTARIANSANNGVSYYQAISTVVGQTYYVQGYVTNISIGGSTREARIIKADDTGVSVNLVTIGAVLQSAGSGWIRGSFTATATTTYIFMNADILGTGTQGADFSFMSASLGGHRNSWNPFNISVTSGATYDSMLDVPTQWADGGNGRGNYCTLNPLSNPNGPLYTVSAGNLTYSCSASAGNAGRMSIAGTVLLGTGKSYWEATPTNTNGNFGIMAFRDQGIDVNAASASNMSYVVGGTAGAINNLAGTLTYTGSAFTYAANDVIGLAYDGTAGSLAFYKNGVLIGTYTGISALTWLPGMIPNTGGAATNFSINFGQQPFAYTPPTGFKALNTLNLPTPTILKGNQYFDASLYTGTGSALSVTNSGSMQPDLVWIKGRSSAYEHALFDSVRGARVLLRSNATAAEVTETAGTSMTAFNSNGFSLGTNGATASTNVNGQTFVGWQWKEGATQGFDIVTYTGNGAASQTLSHSLGVAPAMMISKQRGATGDWFVYHRNANASPQSGALFLSLTNAFTSNSGYWNNTAPTSSQFTVGSAGGLNANGVTAVAHLFAEVAGFSRFGSISANGAADNAFVFTGFLPRFVMLKRTDSTSNWIIWDTARNTYNVLGEELYPNLSNAASTVTDLDVLSNGFKLRNSAFTGTWIYAAFASSPFKNSLAF